MQLHTCTYMYTCTHTNTHLQFWKLMLHNHSLITVFVEYDDMKTDIRISVNRGGNYVRWRVALAAWVILEEREVYKSIFEYFWGHVFGNTNSFLISIKWFQMNISESIIFIMRWYIDLSYIQCTLHQCMWLLWLKSKYIMCTVLKSFFTCILYIVFIIIFLVKLQ